MLDHAVVRIGILEPVIPAIANWKQLSPIFKDINKARSLIKNIFCRLRQFRTIATCYGNPPIFRYPYGGGRLAVMPMSEIAS